MEFPDLNKTAETAKVVSIKDDYGDIIIEFDNGVTFFITADTEWDVGFLRIESSTELEWKRQQEKQAQERSDQAREKQKELQQQILNKFPEEQWPEIKKTFVR